MYRYNVMAEAFLGIFKFFFYIIACIVSFRMGFMHDSKKSGYH